METIKPDQLIRVARSRGGRKPSKKDTTSAYGIDGSRVCNRIEKDKDGAEKVVERRVYSCAETLITRSGKRVEITTVNTDANRRAIESCRTSMLWTPEEEARRDAALGGGAQTVGYAEALKKGEAAEVEFRRHLAEERGIDFELEVEAIDPDIEAFGLSADPDNC